MKKTSLFLTFLTLSIFGCTNTSMEDLIEAEPPPLLVTYTTQVKTIIDNNCIACHSNPPVNGAPISLTTYGEVKNAVQNNSLLDRISKQAGETGAMPLGGPRLSQNQIDLMIQWLTDGLLEN